MQIREPSTYLDVADSVSLLVDVFTIGDDLFDLSTFKEVQLQKLRGFLTEVYGIQNAQQPPAYWNHQRAMDD